MRTYATHLSHVHLLFFSSSSRVWLMFSLCSQSLSCMARTDISVPSKDSLCQITQAEVTNSWGVLSYRLTRRTHANTKLTPLNAWLVIFFQICHSNLPKTSSNAQITTNTFHGVFCWTMDPPCRTCPMKTFCPASKNSIVNGFRGRTLPSQRWPKQSRRTGIWYTKWRARCSQETSLTI